MKDSLENLIVKIRSAIRELESQRVPAHRIILTQSDLNTILEAIDEDSELVIGYGINRKDQSLNNIQVYGLPVYVSNSLEPRVESSPNYGRFITLGYSYHG